MTNNNALQWRHGDIDLIEELARAEARESFYAYRQYMHPEMTLGWWVKETAYHLQQFHQRMAAGERPKLLLMAPPQHGKTSLVEDFIAWVSAKSPNLKTMFTSYSEDLGYRVNATLQRNLDSEKFKAAFPAPRLAQSSDVVRHFRNSSLLEFVDYAGGFRNTTVLGQVTGQSLDFGVIDDPIKGRKEAQSEVIRNGVWNWLTDDFFTRFSDQAAMLLVMTRWHLDDPSGRFIASFPGVNVLSYKAIAEHDEPHRRKGEALFPEFKSLEFLREREKLLVRSSWQSLYQQDPILTGGDMFPIDQFKLVQAKPSHVISSCRYWDKAGTEGGGKFSAGVLMHQLEDQTFLVSDVRRGQWSALQRERIIKQTAQLDGINVAIVTEQEPGSGGKESAESTIRMLSGYTVNADKVTGSKEVRAEPYAAQVQAGNVALLQADWNKAFLDEHEHFPAGTYSDQVDAAAGSFAKLTLGTFYRADMSWVGD